MWWRLRSRVNIVHRVGAVALKVALRSQFVLVWPRVCRSFLFCFSLFFFSLWSWLCGLPGGLFCTFVGTDVTSRRVDEPVATEWTTFAHQATCGVWFCQHSVRIMSSDAPGSTDAKQADQAAVAEPPSAKGDALSSLLDRDDDDSFELDTPRSAPGTTPGGESGGEAQVDENTNEVPAASAKPDLFAEGTGFCVLEIPSTHAKTIGSQDQRLEASFLAAGTVSALDDFQELNKQVTCAVVSDLSADASSVTNEDDKTEQKSTKILTLLGVGLLRRSTATSSSPVFGVEWHTVFDDTARKPLSFEETSAKADDYREQLSQFAWASMPQEDFVGVTSVRPSPDQSASDRKRKLSEGSTDTAASVDSKSKRPSYLNDELDLLSLTYEDYLQAHRAYHSWLQEQAREHGGYRGPGPPRGYRGPPGGYGGPPRGYGGPQRGYGGPPRGYGGPPRGYGGPPRGYGGPPPRGYGGGGWQQGYGGRGRGNGGWGNGGYRGPPRGQWRGPPGGRR